MNRVAIRRLSLGVALGISGYLMWASKPMTVVAAGGCSTGACAAPGYGAQCVNSGSAGCYCCNAAGCATFGYCQE